jgi:uncharacterized protein
MECPVDGETLLLSERQGVEIDYCPKCRGVWLDRGELDKILERSSAELDRSYDRDDDREGRYEGQRQERPYEDRGHEDRGQRHRKRKSFLSEIFEFGGD